MATTSPSRQAERTELQAEIRATSARLERLFQALNLLVARQVGEGK